VPHTWSNENQLESFGHETLNKSANGSLRMHLKWLKKEKPDFDQ